jgi:hypothetical protein
MVVASVQDSRKPDSEEAHDQQPTDEAAQPHEQYERHVAA